ncbi:acyl-CoA dehydrogenase family protein [Amycolatopsis sp. NBC_00438]|uniref:acyl-CoA dehydrogenase family protein n=1 Tax=Amycolatopsis sp. NBC_00438 TaxID=2903558 RepID=UPI002E1DF282
MIEWSETDLLVRDSIREFITKEIRPQLDLLESGQLPPYDIIRKLFKAFGLDVLAAEAVSRVLSPSSSGSSSSLGGQETLALIAISELAGVSLGIVASLGVSLGLTAATILAKGSQAQKERWLPGLATFEKIGAWAITEPDSGSDAFGGMQTTVRLSGDEYVLNGHKTFITNGPHADVVVVYAKLDDGSPPRDRPVLAFVLDRGMPGFVQGKAFKKMGMMSSPTGELFFSDVRLGADRLLSSSGSSDARESFAAERVGVAALSLGIINECQRLCVAYAKSRKLWGQEIGRFQLIQLKLAKMEVARLNVQNMVFQTVAKLRAGKRPSLAEASAMKLYSSEAATEVAMEAVQLFGGNGYMAEYRVEQLARDAKSLMIYAGSNEIQVTHIAKALLA